MRTLTKKEFPVLIFNSTEFSDISFPDKMKMIFHCKQQKQLLAILRHLHSSAETNGCYVYFFFDAINECLVRRMLPSWSSKQATANN